MERLKRANEIIEELSKRNIKAHITVDGEGIFIDFDEIEDAHFESNLGSGFDLVVYNKDVLKYLRKYKVIDLADQLWLWY